ncbi:MAG: M28 family metallopeptidase [Bacteroidales bacterium]|jgi:hypothetical protein|nr:M28 family metallopeptidase [Bacteroidales bacterium]
MKPLILFVSLNLLFGSITAQPAIHRVPHIYKMVETVNTDSLRSYVDQLVAFKSRHSHSSLAVKDQELGAAQDWLSNAFKRYVPQSNGRLSVSIDSYELQPTARVPSVQTYRNAVAKIQGTDVNDTRMFIVMAHLDSRAADGNDVHAYSPGANDDGSGVAALIELCRILSATPHSATIMLVAVSGEEVGLRGSGAMAEKVKAEGWTISAVLNNDMIGQSHGNGTDLRDNTKVRVFSPGIPRNETPEERAERVFNAMDNDGSSRQLARYIKAVGESYVDNLDVVMVYREDRFGRGGDHTSFLNQGFAAVRITEINENFDRQHKDINPQDKSQYGDVIEAMDFEYLRKNTALNLSVVSSLASAPSEPQNARIKINNSDNRSYLSWRAPQYGKVSGYYVLMRETTASQWQKKYFTTETELTLPYFRDNYFFGVQAIGESGTESMVTFIKAEK